MVNKDSKLFASVAYNGVYKSENNGISWTMASEGLGKRTVLNFINSEQYIVAGTDSGIYVSSDYGTSWTPSLQF